MEKPRPGPTALLITVRPAPGKYAVACLLSQPRQKFHRKVLGAQSEAPKRCVFLCSIPICRISSRHSTPNSCHKSLQQNNPRLNSEPCSTTETAPKSGRVGRRSPTLTLKSVTTVGVTSLCMLLFSVYAWLHSLDFRLCGFSLQLQLRTR